MSRMPKLRAFGAERPPVGLGLALSAVAVAAATAIVYPLKSVAPAVSLSVVYVPVVLVVSVYWGLALGLLTSVASAARLRTPLPQRLMELLPGVDVRIVADRSARRSPLAP